MRPLIAYLRTKWYSLLYGCTNLRVRTSLYSQVVLANGAVGPTVLQSEQLVVTIGIAAIVDAWVNGTVPLTSFRYHSSGTSNTPPAIGQTDLIAEIGTRISGTQSSPAPGVVRSLATTTYSGLGAPTVIREHGLHWHISNAASILDRSLLAAPPTVDNGDSINWTFNCTVA